MRAARVIDMDKLADSSKYKSLKIEINSEIVAYIAWTKGHYINQLYVHPNHQRRGLGRKLIDEVCMRATENKLSLKASINAVGFYRALGFIETGPELSMSGIRCVPMEYIVNTV